MKRFLFLTAGISAALAIYLASKHGEGTAAARRIAKGKLPVVELAHQLQDAWADHHTTV